MAIFLELRQKATSKHKSGWKVIWYKYLSMKVVYGEPLLSTEHIYNKTSIY